MPAKTAITVETLVQAPIDKVWNCWTKPEHITQWNAASDDWHCPRATVDLQEGGKQVARMEAKDGSAGFDFEVTFTKVVPQKVLDSVMSDGRKVSVTFQDQGGKTLVTETFDPERENSLEMQRSGWQSILDNFQKHAESQGQ